MEGHSWFQLSVSTERDPMESLLKKCRIQCGIGDEEMDGSIEVLQKGIGVAYSHLKTRSVRTVRVQDQMSCYRCFKLVIAATAKRRQRTAAVVERQECEGPHGDLARIPLAPERAPEKYHREKRIKPLKMGMIQTVVWRLLTSC